MPFERGGLFFRAGPFAALGPAPLTVAAQALHDPDSRPDPLAQEPVEPAHQQALVAVAPRQEERAHDHEGEVRQPHRQHRSSCPWAALFSPLLSST